MGGRTAAIAISHEDSLDRLGMAWPAEMWYESPNRPQGAAMAGSARPDGLYPV